MVSLPPVGILNLLWLICIIFVTRIWSYSYGICAIKMLIIIIIIVIIVIIIIIITIIIIII